MLEESTTSKTTLQISLVLIWFDDSPHSNQRIDKTIDPATDHRDQSMKISSFFNTHYTRISLWNELSQASFYLPTLQVVVELNQLAQGYPTRILGELVVYRNKPTWSRDQHSGQATTWWYFREDIRKITNRRYVTKLENNLAFQGNMIWSNKRGIGTILTHWSKSAPEIRTR